MRTRRLSALLALALSSIAASGAAQTAPTPDRPRFVVLHPAAFAAELAPYLSARRRHFAVEAVTLEELLAGTDGGDDPERVKRFLFRAYADRGVRYALLVGDADVFPVRYLALDRVTPAASDIAFYPSDLYYADLADAAGRFESWNARRDGHHAGYFGEVRGEKNKDGPINADRIDYRPEIALGRWPVRTPAEAARVVAKTLAFEAALARGAPELDRVAVACTGGWVDCRDLLDRAIAPLASRNLIERRYFADDPAKAATPPPTKKEILGLFARRPWLVLHAGHGSDTGWDGCLDLGLAARFDNAELPPIVMSAGCSTARFATLPPYESYVDISGHRHAGTNAGEVFTAPPLPPAPYARGDHNPIGLGEELLRARASGAVAYIGCNTGAQPAGLTLLRGFLAALDDRRTIRHLGDAWSSALRFYVQEERLPELVTTESWYPPSIFFQGMKFMLFGDPTLALP